MTGAQTETDWSAFDSAIWQTRSVEVEGAAKAPSLSAFWLPFGAPGDVPPCIRHLPFDKVTDADPKAIQVLSQGILASLRNHDGSGVQRANEGAPARWRLTAS